jgi:hypothetical protein
LTDALASQMAPAFAPVTAAGTEGATETETIEAIDLT